MGISADPLFQPRDGDLSYTELDTLRAYVTASVGALRRARGNSAKPLFGLLWSPRCPPRRPEAARSGPVGICPAQPVSDANVPKSVPIGHENGPRRSLRGPFPLVAGTGFEPATSGL